MKVDNGAPGGQGPSNSNAVSAAANAVKASSPKSKAPSNGNAVSAAANTVKASLPKPKAPTAKPPSLAAAIAAKAKASPPSPPKPASPKPPAKPTSPPLPATVVITGAKTGKNQGSAAKVLLNIYNQAGCRSQVGGSGPPVDMKYDTLKVANIMSYSLSRNLRADEQLDFFAFAPTGESVNNAPKECSKLVETTNPDSYKHTLLESMVYRGGPCYELNRHLANCVRLWVP